MNRAAGWLILAGALAWSETAWAADGAGIFSERCASCHGPAGQGTASGPALKGNSFVTSGKAAEIKKVIMGGRTAAEKKYPNLQMIMPAGLAGDSEADALVSYLKGDLQK